MSSPPSLDGLKISSPASGSSSSTSKPLPNGVPPVDRADSPSPPAASSPSESTPPQTPGASERPTPETTARSSVDSIKPPSPSLAGQKAGDGPVASAAAAAAAPAPAPAPASAAPVASRPAPSPAGTTGAPRAAASTGRIGGVGRGGIQGPMGMRGAAGQPLQARLPPSLQAKMDKIAASRQGAPSPPSAPSTGLGPNPNATSMGALLRSQALGGGAGGAAGGSGGPSLPGPASGPLSLAARRAGARPNLGSMGMPPSAPGGLQRGPGVAGRRMGPPGGLNLASMGGGAGSGAGGKADNKFTDFNKIMDPSGSLRFSSKAVLTAKGVDFEDGASFKINMDEMDVVGELGKGNYGSVQSVYHRPTGVLMAMKEIRLELDESKLNGIIMELDILHRAVAPEIVEFFGAFTIESCVYYCMELMDAGSLETLTGGGVPAKATPRAPGAAAADGEAEDEKEKECVLRVPEPVLRKITAAMVRGLKFLKDELQIMHRDVKPTNVLINKKGEVKLCDFGVSGQLEKSLAKTNIGCQSYMAPERIKGESQNQLSTYTISSDVWSVGLTIIELAKGCYPYPPETFANVFAQLQAIVYGPAPTLPPGYSDEAQDFVSKCLIKDPNARPTYAQLLEHPFLAKEKDEEVDMVGWVAETLERRASRGMKTPASASAAAVADGA